MAARAVPATLQQLPNALTIARLALIPVFVTLMLRSGGHSWPAGIVFAIAGVTDQVDGYLARRWQVESDFGRIFDPLADRLMIDAAVILLVVQDHMPWAGAGGDPRTRPPAARRVQDDRAQKGYELERELHRQGSHLALYLGVSAA